MQLNSYILSLNDVMWRLLHDHYFKDLEYSIFLEFYNSFSGKFNSSGNLNTPLKLFQLDYLFPRCIFPKYIKEAFNAYQIQKHSLDFSEYKNKYTSSPFLI